MSGPNVLVSNPIAGDISTEQTAPDPRVTKFQSKMATPADQEQAFTEIVTAMQAPLTGYVTARLGPNDAEDIVQTAFFNAYRAMDSFENNGEKALTAWLYKITHNLVLNTVRHGETSALSQAMYQGVEPTALSSRPSHIGIPGAQMEFRETLSALRGIHKTPRTAMIKQYAGYSYVEIAKMQGTTVPTVKSSLVRARERLTRLREEAESFPMPIEEVKEDVRAAA